MNKSRPLVQHELLRVTWLHRTSDELHGRFGGGWQWKLGVQAGGRSAVVSLLVAELKVSWGRRA